MLNLPDFALALQDKGITILLYDPRNTGYSGGQPRNDIDPPQAIGDISDALTHLMDLPSVDPDQVDTWEPPFSVPMVNEHGDNAVGFGHGIDREKYAQFLRSGRSIAPGHVNRVTLMSYYKICMWQPWPLWKLLGLDQGVLLVIPGNDQMSYPELQRKQYDELGGGCDCKKRSVEVESAGHEDILGEDHLGLVVDNVVTFMQDALHGLL
ncbi:hypothetical protein PG985_014741 [Apiospora marii]|uniref:AB hydrolase-1 domain-containing protein n=1 Tax=Apiospora marii TaxID=335849 RepID=A0ABR1R4W1_9PEZI